MTQSTTALLQVELGRTMVTISEVPDKLSAGVVIPLDQLAGAKLEVRISGKLVARGEAVAVGDHFGVRITEVLNTAWVSQRCGSPIKNQAHREQAALDYIREHPECTLADICRDIGAVNKAAWCRAVKSLAKKGSRVVSRTQDKKTHYRVVIGG